MANVSIVTSFPDIWRSEHANPICVFRRYFTSQTNYQKTDSYQFSMRVAKKLFRWLLSSLLKDHIAVPNLPQHGNATYIFIFELWSLSVRLFLCQESTIVCNEFQIPEFSSKPRQSIQSHNYILKAISFIFPLFDFICFNCYYI